MRKEIELSLMLADYHRTRPIHSGEVSVEGVRLNTCVPRISGEACLRPVYEDFDVAEMSLSWYVMAHSWKEPVVALPIFPLRMFIQPYLFCSPSSGIACAEDLRGKRVGIQQYRLTVALWSRGILKEHYGVSPEEIEWVTSEPEGAGYEIPPGVMVTVQKRNPETLLLEGCLDALIAPNIPPSFRLQDPRIRRVFPDCRSAVREYFLKTKIFPITHTLVVREQLLEEYPWIAGKLLRAFRDADLACRQSYEYPKRLSFPTAVLLLEEEEEIFGKDPWPHGVEANQTVLEKFIQYAEEQGYIPSRPNVRELFVSES